MKRLIAFLILVTSSLGYAQTQPLGATIKEIYMKGSIEGDNLTMVYGFEDMAEDVKEHIKNSVQVQDFEKLGKLIFNKGDDDYIEAVKEGAKETASVAKKLPKRFGNIFTKPWKSIKKIPGSYKVNFENATEAFYDANNRLSGAVKYTGWALWANIEGAYYLIVEAPVVMVSHAIAAGFSTAWMVAAIPVSVVIQTFRVAFQVTWIGLRFVGNSVGGASRIVYSAVSTSIAAAITASVAGGIAAFTGGKWLVAQPRKLLRPYKVTHETETGYSRQQNLAERLKQHLLSLDADYEMVSENIARFKSKFTLNYQGVKSLIVRTRVNAEKQVEITAEATAKYKRLMKKLNPELDATELRAKITAELAELVTLE
jgi:hypothetical protein